jgi:putative ABC transport system permease protein
VYGVASQSVAARTREFGIRMALGATAAGVRRSVLRDGLRSVALGVALGLPLAIMVASRVRDLLYQVHPFDPPTVVAIVALLGAAAIAASLVPARRATRVDPAMTLRQE